MKEFFSRENIIRLLKYGLYLMLSLMIQNTLFTKIRPLGVCPMMLPCVAVAVGMFEGGTFGAVFSLIMGILADMAFIENKVTFTILFPILSFGAGVLTRFYINRRFVAYIGVAVLALIITAVVQVLHTIAVDTFSGAMLSTAVLQTLWSLPTAVIAYLPPGKWID